MRSDTVNSLLLQASELDAQGRWREAAETYENAFRYRVNQGDYAGACDLLIESVAHWEKAAYQAKSFTEFSDRIGRGRKLCVEGIALSEKLEESRKRMWVLHFESQAMYFDGVLDPNQDTRLRKLDECISLAKNSLSTSEELKDKLSVGRCCNQLMKYLFELALIETDPSKVVASARAAPGYGERAIASFLELGDESGLARAYYFSGISHFSSIDTLESEGERGIARKRASSYLSKALEISEKAGEKVVSGSALTVLGALSEEWSEPDKFQKALDIANGLQDNLLIARALALLLVSARWRMHGQEEEQKVRDLFGKELEHLSEVDKHCERFAGTWKEWVRSVAYGIVADDYRWLAEFIETEPSKKIELLGESIKLGNRGLEAASTTGKVHCLNALSRASHYLASITADPEDKSRLLDQALTSRLRAMAVHETLEPFYYWYQGVSYSTMSLIQADLAEQSSEKERIDLYLESNRNVQRGLDFFRKHASEIGKLAPGQHAELGRYLESFSRIQRRLYELTKDKKYLTAYAEILGQAAENYDVAGIQSRAAEMLWRAAIMQSQAGLHVEASEKFLLASRKYAKASQIIQPFKTHYREYAAYMFAWSKIEKARHDRLRGLHYKSRASYEAAARVLGETNKWRGLAPYYLAWSILEKAEALSNRDRPEQALKEFARGAEKFGESSSLTEELGREGILGQEYMSSFWHESKIWNAYCLSRMKFDEAMIHQSRGDSGAGSTKYGEAADVVERLVVTARSEEDARSLRGTALFYRGLQQLSVAEDRSDPKFYFEAAEFFDRAMNESYDRRIRLSSAGNASLCRALETVERFRRTKSMDIYSAAKLHLEAAADFFLEAGLDKPFHWVKATRDLIDAHAYLISAELTIEPRRKREFFELSEKYLTSSGNKFRSMGNKSKADEISNLLDRVREERAFVARTIEVPAPISLVGNSAATLLMAGQEETVGLKDMEHANIQVQLTTSGEAILGQQLDLRLDFANVGGSTATLLRIEDPVPSNVQAEVVSSGYSLEHGSIDLRARRLESMKLETLRLKIKPLEAGEITFSPRVVYVTASGEIRSNVVRPTVLPVQPPREFQFKSTKSKRVFDYLLDSFIEDHMQRKFFVEKAGWRTLMDIVKSARIPKSSVYGVAGPGDALMELLRQGLVESKEFPGERGRGGRVVRIRISYEKEPIKRFVDERILRG